MPGPLSKYRIIDLTTMVSGRSRQMRFGRSDMLWNVSGSATNTDLSRHDIWTLIALLGEKRHH